MSIQFIACTNVSCPLNESKQCRSPFVRVGEDGDCLTANDASAKDKSSVEGYVDLTECQCIKCRHWEENASNGKGDCGFRADLFFNSDGVCNEIESQISEPGFKAIV